MHLINRLLRLAPVVLVPLLVLAACNRPLAQTPLTSATELPAQPITETQTLSATNALTQSEPISPAEALVSATNALTQSELISPADTFILATATPAAAGAGVDSTNVAFVQALVNVNLRSGPGAEYEIVGQVFAGQTAQVTGVSSDGQWWRVICPDNTVGDCFVAADPTLTQPANAPGDAPVTAPVQESGQALVEELTVHVMESFPVQINAVLRGFLRDSCSTIDSYDQVREGQTIRLRLTTSRPADALCLTVLTPFEQIIPLNVVGLSAGEYDVRINELVAPFTLTVDNVPTLPPVMGTNVDFVMAQNDVTIHAGPSAASPVVGSVAGGMIAKVTGVSADGQWWRVICPDDSEGSCWVTADPAQTQPTTTP